MALLQFNCPHCHSLFQVEASLASLHVACPHCHHPVALISEPPIAESPRAPPVLEPPPIAPPLVESRNVEPPSPLSAGSRPTSFFPPPSTVARGGMSRPQAKGRESLTDNLRLRHRAADERAARKFVKNMIVWVGCAIVLVSILAFFVMQGRW